MEEKWTDTELSEKAEATPSETAEVAEKKEEVPLKKQYFIGVWDYTVILTYLGFIAAISGIVFALTRNPITNERWPIYIPVFCLMFAGLCDMFDGAVAKTKKDRTAHERSFGEQIDSLSDIVSFGVLPAVIGYRVAFFQPYWIILLAFYCLMALVRLAHFNVEEEERKAQGGGKRTFYYGLPMTNAAWIFPMLFCFKPLLGKYFGYLYALGLLVVGFLFVYKFKMIKITGKKLIWIALSGAVVFAVILILGFTLHIEW